MLISDKYEVRGQLGQGSMGVVYKVCHTALGTTSALKVLSTHLTGNPDIVKRFYREARVMARLTHPNIVRVVDVQHDGALDFHYFVMEYVEGLTLGSICGSRVLCLFERSLISRAKSPALWITPTVITQP